MNRRKQTHKDAFPPGFVRRHINYFSTDKLSPFAFFFFLLSVPTARTQAMRIDKDPYRPYIIATARMLIDFLRLSLSLFGGLFLIRINQQVTAGASSLLNQAERFVGREREREKNRQRVYKNPIGLINGKVRNSLSRLLRSISGRKTHLLSIAMHCEKGGGGGGGITKRFFSSSRGRIYVIKRAHARFTCANDLSRRRICQTQWARAVKYSSACCMGEKIKGRLITSSLLRNFSLAKKINTRFF